MRVSSKDVVRLFSRLTCIGVVVVCAAASGVGAPRAAQAATQYVADGQFTQGSANGAYTTYYSPQTMGGWTVSAGNVDLIGNYWQAPAAGQQSVDLTGFTQGTIGQVVHLTPGKNTYHLSFQIAGNPYPSSPNIKELQVSLGSFSATTTFPNTTLTSDSSWRIRIQQRGYSYVVRDRRRDGQWRRAGDHPPQFLDAVLTHRPRQTRRPRHSGPPSAPDR